MVLRRARKPLYPQAHWRSFCVDRKTFVKAAISSRVNARSSRLTPSKELEGGGEKTNKKAGECTEREQKGHRREPLEKTEHSMVKGNKRQPRYRVFTPCSYFGKEKEDVSRKCC